VLTVPVAPGLAPTRRSQRIRPRRRGRRGMRHSRVPREPGRSATSTRCSAATRTNVALRHHPPRALLPIRPDLLRGAGAELATLQRSPKRLNDLRNHPPSEDHSDTPINESVATTARTRSFPIRSAIGRRRLRTRFRSVADTLLAPNADLRCAERASLPPSACRGRHRNADGLEIRALRGRGRKPRDAHRGIKAGPEPDREGPRRWPRGHHGRNWRLPHRRLSTAADAPAPGRP
jgi:hypothetical protein